MNTRTNLAFVILPALALSLLVTPAEARQFSPPVLLPGDMTLAPAAGEQGATDVARGANGYLAVWEDARSFLTGSVATVDGLNHNMDIYAAVLDAAGQVVGASPLIVNQDSYSQIRPHVAWNGENYLVVWQTRRLSGIWHTDGIYAARVSPTGVLLDDPPIVIEDDDDQDELYPLVASDGHDWFVLWTDFEAGQSSFMAGAIVNPAGQVILKQTVMLPGSQSNVPRNYELGFAVDRYLFIYENGWGGAATGTFIDTSLNTLGGAVTFSAGVTGFRPSVGGNANGFFVAWTSPVGQSSGIVRGTPVSTAGVSTVPGGADLSAGLSVWTSAASSTVGWDGSGWTIAWESFDFANQNSLNAAQVSSAGAHFPGSPFQIIPSSGEIRAPAAANGNGHAMLLWDDGRNSPQFGLERDVYGATVAPGSSVGPEHAVALGPPAQTHPALAGDREHGYLLVFRSEMAGVRRVLAQRLDGLGVPIDPQPTVIASGGFLVGGHDVAWNGSEWLVVWEQRLGSSSLLTARVLGVRMDASGTLLDAVPLDIVAGNAPAVGALGGDFLVVASDEPTNHVRFIRRRRVRGSDGALLDGSEVAVSGSYSQSPDVVGLDDRWLVAWHQRPTHDSPFASILGAHVLADGTPLGSFSMESASGSKHFSPSLAVGDTVASVTWADSDDIRARLITMDGTMLGNAAGFVVVTAPNVQFAPSIGWDGERFLVAFGDYRRQTGIEPGVGDVWSGRFERDGSLLDFSPGVPVGAHYLAAEGNAEVAGGGGIAITAHAALRIELPYATHRIVLRTMDGEGVGDRFCFGGGFGAACPCGNEAQGGGCANSTGQGGALSATGSASVSADALLFLGDDLPASQPALLFQGTGFLAGGDGVVFGDGLRCVDGFVVRLSVVTSMPSGAATWGPGLGAVGSWAAGQTLHFQAWYRDPAGSPCGSLFNLTNALSVTLVP